MGGVFTKLVGSQHNHPDAQNPRYSLTARHVSWLWISHLFGASVAKSADPRLNKTLGNFRLCGIAPPRAR